MGRTFQHCCVDCRRVYFGPMHMACPFCDPIVENPTFGLDVDITLREARVQMLEKAGKGTACPCCGQLVKLYSRKLHTEMALFLIKLVRAYRREPRWYSTRELIPSVTKSATDGAYLTRWRLLERAPSENSSGGKAGLYRPTEAGIDFVLGLTRAASHAYILCGKLLGFKERRVSIQECLGRKFNYNELMYDGDDHV